MLALDKKKISTKLIGFWEDAGGQLWLDMKRGSEEKKLVIGYGWHGTVRYVRALYGLAM